MAEKAKRPTKRSERVWKNREPTGGSVNISARHLQMAKDVANFCIHPLCRSQGVSYVQPGALQRCWIHKTTRAGRSGSESREKGQPRHPARRGGDALQGPGHEQPP
jgi:hypothetical protein